MAEVVLTPELQKFPIGTKVKVKQLPSTSSPAPVPGSGEPAGALVAEPEVVSPGTLTVAGVEQGKRYVGWARIAEVDRYISFGGPVGGAGEASGPILALTGEELLSSKPGELLRVLLINFDLSTSATAGKRYVGWEIAAPGGQTFAEALTPEISTISTTFGVSCFRGAVPVSGAALGISSRTINLPLPVFDLPYGWKYKLISPTTQAGDSFPLFRWLYEYVKAPIG
jgi:hypothetical protein